MLKKFKSWWTSKKQKRELALFPERSIVVRFDNVGISANFPDGKTESVAWAELNKVEIHTNDSGPWGADVWYVLSGTSGQCAFPQGASGEDKVLERLQALPGFDNNAFIMAMGSIANAVIVCWEGDSALPGSASSQTN